MVIPKLRFKGFDKSWNTVALSNISQIITGSTPATSERQYYNGDFLFVSPADMQGNRYIETTKTTLTADGFGVCRHIPENSVLFVCIGSTIGKVAQNKEVCATNQQINVVVPKKGSCADFLYSLLEKYSSKIKLMAGVQAVPLINKTEFGKTLLSIPELEEQTKIASFLSAVDDKIAQLTKEHELLSEYKKGMMQQLFSQTMRFKADDGSDFEDWEERTLGEVSTTFSGGTPTSSNKLFYEGQIPFIKSGEISQSNTAQFINELALANSSAKLVKKGDLLYALYGATSGQVAIAQLEGAINQAVLCIRSKTLVTNYLYNFLLFKKEEILSTYLQGGQGNLSASILKEIHIPIPCFKEQTKIANFLFSIDEKIENVATQIDQAKVWKKGLLQQMFV